MRYYIHKRYITLHTYIAYIHTYYIYALPKVLSRSDPPKNFPGQGKETDTATDKPRASHKVLASQGIFAQEVE